MGGTAERKGESQYVLASRHRALQNAPQNYPGKEGKESLSTEVLPYKLLTLILPSTGLEWDAGVCGR